MSNPAPVTSPPASRPGPLRATTPAPAIADESEADALVAGIAIPPRPALLADVQREMCNDDPDLRRVARLIAGDVALTAGVLRTVNSPLYAPARPIATVEQGLSMLGLRRITTIVTIFSLQQAVKGDSARLVRFWDVSNKRSEALARMARGLRGVDVDTAQTFGLFCDVGIPMLMLQFPDYATTLKAANRSETLPFTSIEREAHRTDHATIGALVARSWCLPRIVCDAIRLHHDYEACRESGVAEPVLRLIAMGLVAEVAIQRFARLNESKEWRKAGEWAAGALVLGPTEVEDWIEDLVDGFAAGG